MFPINQMRKLLRNLLKKSTVEQDMDEEIELHVALETEENIRAGMDPQEARRQALVRFGGVERFKEEARTVRRGRLLEDFAKDIRVALRGLRRSPGFATVALTMLALGIGANTAIFSVIHAVILEPLPYHQPDRLVQVFETHMAQGWDHFSFSRANLQDLMESGTSLEGLAGITGGSANITENGPPALVGISPVTPGFFATLGVGAIHGRTFLDTDVAGEEVRPVVLVGEDTWAERFGSDPDVIGRTVILDDEAHEIVGVVPVAEPWLQNDFYRPFSLDGPDSRDNHFLRVIARLPAGVTIEAARAELTPLALRFNERNAPIDEGMGFQVESSDRWAASADVRQTLWVLMGAVGFLLLIACMNLTNLLLSRVTGRRRQVAMQVALGAGRGRVIRQLLTESAVLGLLGAALGLGVALLGLKQLVALEPGDIPRLEGVSVNGWVLAFTAAVAVATGLVGGLLPAVKLPADRLGATLREGGRGSGGARGGVRARSLLVSAETALSLVLLVGAGLLFRSLIAVNTVDMGFESENRLTFAVNVPDSYSFADSRAFRGEFLARLRGLGQVESAAAVHMRPVIGGNTVMSILPDGETVETFGGAVSADWRFISDDYFETLGLELMRGSDLSHGPPPQDAEGTMGPMEIVVSESLAAAVWPGEDPIGRLGQLWITPDRLGRVVGVVEDMRERGPGLDETRAIYFSYNGGGWSPVHFVVHTRGEPRGVLPLARAILGELDPDLPLTRAMTMDEMVRDSTASRRFTLVLLGVFAGVALVLALAGLYGVISDSVNQRARELGVRVALGASSDDVMSLVLRSGMLPATLGIGAGLVAALGLSRVLRSLLFGVGATDLATYGAMAAVLGLAALAACWIPARAALRLDPMAVLRDE